MNDKIVYLNGKYLPLAEAQISVLDRGFLFADGVYEVVPIYSGKTFGLTEHLNRLQYSLDQIKIKHQVSHDTWRGIITQLLAKNQQKDCAIYIQITRGADIKRTHGIPQNITPTIFAQISGTKKLPHEELSKGKTAFTFADTRWENCHIKSISLLANILAYQQAYDLGSDEAILIRDGFAVEGSSSNIFIVKNNKIKTPPLAHSILAGITRETILKLAERNNIACEETKITEAELFAADEVWITSSTREIYPIVSINNQPVGTGLVGPIWQKMIELYHDYINYAGPPFSRG